MATKAIACSVLLIDGGVIIIFAPSIFMVYTLPNQSAFATFPGENGKIAFHKQLENGKRAIYTINQDGSGVTQLSGNDHYDLNPSWSADGSKIAFERGLDGASTTDVYVMNFDGSGVKRLTYNPAFDAHPSWSPDGSKIVFQSDRDGDYEIYVMNADDGSGLSQLTNNNIHDFTPNWSPDGSKIAFGSMEGDHFGELYVMNTDGTAKTRLTDTIGGAFPSWSPDGKMIAVEFDEGIYVMNADDGSEVTRLTPSTMAEAGEPSWSPDGQKMAFVACDSPRECGGGELYVMNADDGSEVTRLTSNSDEIRGTDWVRIRSTTPPEEGTISPVITVPNDITEDATGPDGAQVSFEVSAEDDVEGPVDVSCDHNSGDTFPIGETVVTCSAEDLTGNRAEESFTITVQDTNSSS